MGGLQKFWEELGGSGRNGRDLEFLGWSAERCGGVGRLRGFGHECGGVWRNGRVAEVSGGVRRDGRNERNGEKARTFDSLMVFGR